MNNWLIGCNCKASFSAPIISIASLCSKTFSGLGSFIISISPVLWTSFSGLTIPAMNNWLIGCNCNGSFSAPTISTASLCSNTFSGLGVFSITNSPVLWTSFSGLVIPAMNNWLIGCNCKGSFSAPIISIASLCSNTFSGLGVFSITNSPVLWTSFSGLVIPAMNNWLIGCNCNGSFSAPIISTASLCSNTFSGLGVFSITISPLLWTSFSGLVTPAMNNWLIGCNCNGSFSAPTISTASLCSNTFSGLGVFSITISPLLCTSFSGLSIPPTYNASINCLTNGSFSKDTISIASLCSISFSGLSVFSIFISPSLCWVRFSQGLFSPWTNI